MIVSYLSSQLDDKGNVIEYYDGYKYMYSDYNQDVNTDEAKIIAAMKVL